MPAEELNKTPGEIPEEPKNISQGAAQAGQIIRGIQDSLSAVQLDIKDLRREAHHDFWSLLKTFGAGFIILGGMLIYGYFRLEDQITALDRTLIKVETKLDDLLQRIPPVPTPPKR